MMRAVSLAMVFGAAAAWAQDAVREAVGPGLVDVVNARNLGMGSAYMSLGYGTEAILGNPAAMSLYPRFQIEASGAYDIAHQAGFFTAAAMDSQTSAMGLGVSYSYISFGGEAGRRHAHLPTVAASYALGESATVGVSLRYFGVLGETGGPQSGHTLGVNVGACIRPVKQLVFGLSGHNLILGTNPDVHRFGVLSVSTLLFEQLTLAVDGRLELIGDLPRFAIQAGLEWLIAKKVPVRFGYQGDFIRSHQYLSGGVGLFFDGSGIDVAYRHELGGANGRFLALTLKLQLRNEEQQ
jgi:hypothetical protein